MSRKFKKPVLPFVRRSGQGAPSVAPGRVTYLGQPLFSTISRDVLYAHESYGLCEAAHDHKHLHLQLRSLRNSETWVHHSHQIPIIIVADQLALPHSVTEWRHHTRDEGATFIVCCETPLAKNARKSKYYALCAWILASVLERSIPAKNRLAVQLHEWGSALQCCVLCCTGNNSRSVKVKETAAFCPLW